MSGNFLEETFTLIRKDVIHKFISFSTTGGELTAFIATNQ